MQKWEYTTLTTEAKSGFLTPAYMDADAFREELNGMGQQGWEVVSMIQVARGGIESREVVVLLKRPLPD